VSEKNFLEKIASDIRELPGTASARAGGKRTDASVSFSRDVSMKGARA
jgi:hypothetical protein